MMNNYENKQSTAAAAASNLMFLLIGGGIGATVALLFAPKPGKELRQDASDALKQGMDAANKTVTQIRETADDYYHKAQEKASDIYRVAFKSVSDGTQEAKALADRSFDQVQQTLDQVAPENSGQMPHEQGKHPFNRNDVKTGIL